MNLGNWGVVPILLSTMIISATTPGAGVLLHLTPGLEKEIRGRLSQVRRGKKVKGGRLVVGVPVPVRRPMLMPGHHQAGIRLLSGSEGNPVERNSVFLVGHPQAASDQLWPPMFMSFTFPSYWFIFSSITFSIAPLT